MIFAVGNTQKKKKKKKKKRKKRCERLGESKGEQKEGDIAKTKNKKEQKQPCLW